MTAESPAATTRRSAAPFTARATSIGAACTPSSGSQLDHRLRNAARSAECLQQFLMDAAESAVRHQHDQVAGSMLTDHRLNDVVERLSLTCGTPAGNDIADQLPNRQPLR